MVQPPFEIFVVSTWLRVLTWCGTFIFIAMAKSHQSLAGDRVQTLPNSLCECTLILLSLFAIFQLVGLEIGGIPLSVVCPCLHGAVRHRQIQNNLMIRSKNGEANVANVKYCFLSNDGHSVRFLNRFGKFIYLSLTISEMFFFT